MTATLTAKKPSCNNVASYILMKWFWHRLQGCLHFSANIDHLFVYWAKCVDFILMGPYGLEEYTLDITFSVAVSVFQNSNAK